MCVCVCARRLGTRARPANDANQLANWKWCEPNLCVVNLILFMVWLVFNRFVFAFGWRRCRSYSFGWRALEDTVRKSESRVEAKLPIVYQIRKMKILSSTLSAVGSVASHIIEQKRQCKSIESRGVSRNLRLDNGYCIRILPLSEPEHLSLNRKENGLLLVYGFYESGASGFDSRSMRATKRMVKVEHEIRAIRVASCSSLAVGDQIECTFLLHCIAHQAPRNVFSIHLLIADIPNDHFIKFLWFDANTTFWWPFFQPYNFTIILHCRSCVATQRVISLMWRN